MKKPFLQYAIPVLGLKMGAQAFKFELEEDFFSQFEQSPIEQGKGFSITMELDKRHDMVVLQFDFSGTIKSACDRCLADIWLPVQGSEQLVVKYAEKENFDGDEVVFITLDTHELNVAKFIYEYICLSMPLVRIYDCRADEEDSPCDQAMLAFLAKQTDEMPPQNIENPLWDELKKIK